MGAQIIWTREDGSEASLQFDVTASEQHDATATPTERAVEEGAPATDHVIQDHDQLRLRGWVSNTPVNPGSLGSESQLIVEVERMTEAVGARFVSSGGAIANDLQSRVTVPLGRWEDRALARRQRTKHVFGLQTVQFPVEFDRVGVVYRVLLSLKERAQVVRVLTALREYERLVIEQVSAPVQDTADAVQMDLAFKQIRTAKAEVVAAPEPVEPRGRQQKSRGQQDTEDAGQQDDLDVAAYEPETSIAKDLFG